MTENFNSETETVVIYRDTGSLNRGVGQLVYDALVQAFGEMPQLPVSDGQYDKAKIAIAEAVFKRNFADSAELSDFISEQPLLRAMRANLLNRHLVEATGVGPDYFTVSSIEAPTMTIGHATTLRDLDREWATFKAGVVGDVADELKETLYNLWTRRIVDGKLVYGFVYTAGQYLWSALEDTFFEFLQEQPSDFLLSKIDGVSVETLLVGEGSKLMGKLVADQKRDAEFLKDPAWVVRNVASDQSEEMETVIFSNVSALAQVRMAEYGHDISKLSDGSHRLDTYVSALQTEFRQGMTDIATNLESTIASDIAA
jgi:hypothetical protein